MKLWSSGFENPKFEINQISPKSMKKFGPFFPEVDENINQFTYRSLLQRKMFRHMKRDLFNLTMWQKDEAKPHPANMVIEWLIRIFDNRMPAIKSKRGDTLAPLAPNLSPLVFPPVGVFEGAGLQNSPL